MVKEKWGVEMFKLLERGKLLKKLTSPPKLFSLPKRIPH